MLKNPLQAEVKRPQKQTGIYKREKSTTNNKRVNKRDMCTFPNFHKGQLFNILSVKRWE
jgi:hypothetical protein